MQVSLENTANLERRLTVSLPAERLEGVVGNRLRELASTANIKGFRKGKVPTKVIEQRFGAQVRNEAYGELIRESLGEAIRNSFSGLLARFDGQWGAHRTASLAEGREHAEPHAGTTVRWVAFGGRPERDADADEDDESRQHLRPVG